jgi:GAF domain-containing protein
MEVRLFSNKQVKLLETFADQAVIAIENARLFDEVQSRTRELARSVAELKALSEVSQAVNASLDRVGGPLWKVILCRLQIRHLDRAAIHRRLCL